MWDISRRWEWLRWCAWMRSCTRRVNSPTMASLFWELFVVFWIHNLIWVLLFPFSFFLFFFLLSSSSSSSSSSFPLPFPFLLFSFIFFLFLCSLVPFFFLFFLLFFLLFFFLSFSFPFRASFSLWILVEAWTWEVKEEEEEEEEEVGWGLRCVGNQTDRYFFPLPSLPSLPSLPPNSPLSPAASLILLDPPFASSISYLPPARDLNVRIHSRREEKGRKKKKDLTVTFTSAFNIFLSFPFLSSSSSFLHLSDCVNASVLQSPCPSSGNPQPQPQQQ